MNRYELQYLNSHRKATHNDGGGTCPHGVVVRVAATVGVCAMLSKLLYGFVREPEN